MECSRLGEHHDGLSLNGRITLRGTQHHFYLREEPGSRGSSKLALESYFK